MPLSVKGDEATAYTFAIRRMCWISTRLMQAVRRPEKVAERWGLSLKEIPTQILDLFSAQHLIKLSDF